MGQILGCCCALCGVLVIALPVSVVATNFQLFYTYAKARLNLPPKAEQKLPLSKELKSLKAKKDELVHMSTNHSTSSIPRRFEHPTKGSVERLSPENDEKAAERSSHRSSGSERRRDDSGTSEQNSPFYENSENTRMEDTMFTPSFQEQRFDFLQVPKNKPLKRSFLSSSFSRLFGGKTQTEKPDLAPDCTALLDFQTTYPLYSRRCAVVPGLVSSRSLSSTIYDSTSSNLPSCVRRSMDILRHKQLKRSRKLSNTRKCTSDAELHLVYFHRCNRHPPGDEKEMTNSDSKLTSSDCTCSPHIPSYPKPRLAKSCSELNDILQGNYRSSLYSVNSNHLISSGDIKEQESGHSNAPLSEIAITINECSEEGVCNVDKSSFLTVNSPSTKRTYLHP